MSTTGVIGLAIHVLLAGATGAGEQFQFVDVSGARGIQAYAMAPGLGGGVAAADFDDDGDIDLFVPTAEGVPDQLYRNLGDGHFEEIAVASGLGSMARSRAALWLDYDGDHLLDLFVAGDCFGLDAECTEVSTVRLYRQLPGGGWEEVSVEAGIVDDLVWHTGQHRGGLCAGDVNEDGYLDLITGLWSGEARLLLNTGNGAFEDVSITSGLGGASEGHWQPVMHDFNGDGLLDVFSAIDFTANHLWLNVGDASFFDIAVAAGVDTAWNDMGVAVGDCDNDGDLDVFVSEIFEQDRHNVLFRNDSSGPAVSFTDVAETAGVDDTSFGWGATFLDADNDGWLDLAVTNGYFNQPWLNDASRFFLNSAGPSISFADVSTGVGFDDTDWGSALIAADLDRDGDLDLVQTCASPGPLRLLYNQQAGPALDNHYLVIQPRSSGVNRRAIGAVVRITIGGLNLTRLITAGTSYLGQEPAEAFFGVGPATFVDEVAICWPDGTETVLSNVATDQVLVVGPSGCGTGDLNCDGAVDTNDFLSLLSAWGPCPAGGGCAADLDGDGAVGANDFLLLLANWG